MALSATGSSPSDRDSHLWDEELGKVRARRETMTPAAVAAVESVLRSIRSEQAEDDSLVLYTLSVLEGRKELQGPVRRGRLAVLLLKFT